MSGITVTEFARVQQEVLKLKSENHMLKEQLQKTSSAPQTFLQSWFSSSESSEIEKLQKEEAELKKSFQAMQDHNDSLREQIKEANISDSLATQIATLEALFKTKKRELIRMHELNATTLSDLEEEVELSRGLCESLENGRASLTRDKEALENTIRSLKGAKQSIETRLKDLEELNQQLRQDLGVRAADGSEYADLAIRIEESREGLDRMEKELAEMKESFEKEETRLAEIEEKKRKQCETIDASNQGQAAKVEEQLKALRNELQSLKSRDKVEETVEIDVDSLVKENADLQARIDELEKRREVLAGMVMANQIDCVFLTAWLKREPKSHTDANSVFRDLMEQEERKKKEFAELGGV